VLANSQFGDPAAGAFALTRVASPFSLLLVETEAPVRAKEWVRERGRMRVGSSE
jgi:hypothetical protein